MSYPEAMGKESTSFFCKGAFPDGCVGTEEELGKGALFADCGWSSGKSSNMMSVLLIGGALGKRLVLFVCTMVRVGGAAVT